MAISIAQPWYLRERIKRRLFANVLSEVSVNTIQLNKDIEVDPTQIASVTLEKKGAKISSKVVSVSSGDFQDLRVPEDSLIVRLSDGAEFAIRGEQEAKSAWDQLRAAKEAQSLGFGMSISNGS